MIEIDHRHLEPGTLDALLMEIVLRDGTDYGEVEVPVVDRKKQLLNLLNVDQAVIVYHTREGFCDVVRKTESSVSS